MITIFKRMGIKIIFQNQRFYKNEKIADIFVKSPKKLKSINCPSYLNSGAIDEFLIIFLVAAKCNGISYFKDLSELNQKESPRLKLGSKILNQMGVKTITTKNSIKIFGKPNLYPIFKWELLVCLIISLILEILALSQATNILFFLII